MGHGSVERVVGVLLTMQRQSWEQGVAAQAAADLGHDDVALLLADAAVTRQAPDGRLGVVEDERGAVNGAACGESVLLAARLTGQPRWSRAAQRQVDWLVHGAPRAGDGTLFHLLGSREVWADTVYMVVALLAATGHTELALAQVDGHRRRLYDEVGGLYAARWDEDAAVPNGPEHWGAASGWVAAGIARALRVAHAWPAGDRERLGGHVRGVLDACLAHRRADGLFGNVLDDPTSFRETNVAQMLAYAALVGAADGWLPPAYGATGRDLLAAAGRQVDARGFVTGACGSPRFDGPGVSAEAQAFHLLAVAARSTLDRRTAPP
ncbi:MAG: unsaturated rhamnogalacturonyl hydrolase [Micromonosporaceae bacterium]|nr:unsaturated rhamnogalacturonyl hydrolase [Micromonosporaceae bacterium]